MIKLKIVSPMPDMLGLAFSGHTFRKEIEYQLGMTAGNIMDILAEENPGFKELWEKKTCVALETCLFAVDGTLARTDEGKWDIEIGDGVELTMFMPYAGG